jgi:hypothetical protein
MLAVRTLLLVSCLASAALAETLTLPADQRPAWMARDGIVMAGSWEPLIFRVRRDGAQGYTPSAEQLEGYRREHSPEMVARLKQLGVNFVMMHCYKGGGLKAEQESMQDAVRFARLCHEAGMRVGVYNYSGAFIWELFFPEMPQAKDWVVLNAQGEPVPYGRDAGYRYYWNRNHPDAQAFYRKVVHFGVCDIQADLIHFDNYHVGPGWDRNSIDRFRQYLSTTFPAALLAEHHIDPASANPPLPKTTDLLARAWADFSCQSMADSYAEMCRYARTLRRDVLLECNPAGVSSVVRMPIDHGRLLQAGEAYWDESGLPGYRKGRLQSRIRTCKVARAMNNAAFAYTTTPWEAAESTAFNLDCLGAICWFEYAKTVERPGAKKLMSPSLAPYVQFFHAHRDLLGGARVVADAAVLRSFPSMAFGEPATARLTGAVEDTLILNRVPFQILHEHQLPDARRYPVLVLAGCVAISDQTVSGIRKYVTGGGRLCVVGPLATHNEWMLPRNKPALDDLPAASVARIQRPDDVPATLGPLSIQVTAKPGVCAEFTEQPARRMVHLVNYRDDGPAEQVAVKLRIPAGKQVGDLSLMSPEHGDSRPLPFQQHGDQVEFTVPTVNVYEIAVLRWR